MNQRIKAGQAITLSAIGGIALATAAIVVSKKYNLLDTSLQLPWYIIGGLAIVLPSLLLMWYWRKTSKDKDIENKLEEIFIEQERVLHERLDRAIILLGHDKPAVRMGGIFSLELIAGATSIPEDYTTIIETLCAYIRENANVFEAIKGSPDMMPQVFEDVQAALTVLGRRAKIEDEARRLDLNSTNLCRIRLPQGNLSGANLVNADLSRAYLAEINLERANLKGASLEHASLANARLDKAYLVNANLKNARLMGAVFDDTSLMGANLEGAHLERAKLKHAYLEEANLRGAFFDPSTTIFPDDFDPIANGLKVAQPSHPSQMP